MYRLCANATPFYVRALHIFRFWNEDTGRFMKLVPPTLQVRGITVMPRVLGDRVTRMPFCQLSLITTLCQLPHNTKIWEKIQESSNPKKMK